MGWVQCMINWQRINVTSASVCDFSPARGRADYVDWAAYRQEKLHQFRHEIAALKALPQLTGVQQCELRLLQQLERLLES
jgi:hypothetical protein